MDLKENKQQMKTENKIVLVVMLFNSLPESVVNVRVYMGLKSD